jgi:predicted transcriptional regulator
MPKKGPNEKKLETIMKIIRSTKSNGIWIRELARQTNLPLTTVHFYINKFLKDRVKIETVKIGELLINK